MPIIVSLVEDNHRMRESFAEVLNRAPGIKSVQFLVKTELAF